MNGNQRRVTLLLNLQIGYCRRVVTGVAALAQRKGWLLEEMPANPGVRERLERSQPDGVIAHVLDEPLAEVLQDLKCPVVSVSSNLPKAPFPSLDVDHRAIGRMAAEYFLDLGHSQFAFFGSATAVFSMAREDAFVETLRDHGFVVERNHAEYVLRPPYDEYSRGSEDGTRRWLKALPKPVAILCSNDEHARLLSFLCQSGGVSVPDEVALLGVDNDLTICALGSPPLSSIDNPAEEVGFQAAGILNRLMAGKKVAAGVISVQPVHVVERPSTDRFAVDDALIQKSIAFIKRNLREVGMGVVDVSEHVGVSRRSLERAFSGALGMTVLGVIHRQRIRRAKSLLSHTDLPTATIAAECGFSNHRRFGIVFKGQMRMTPSQFRQLSRFESQN